MKWIAIAVSLIMLASVTQAQETTEAESVADTGASAEPDPVVEREPGAELSTALAYELPEYECKAPNQFSVGSSPISRRRFERRWDDFNDCRGEYFEVLQSDFADLQAAGEEAWLEAQQITLNDHLTAINDQVGEIMQDPYMSDEDRGPMGVEAPRDMPQGGMGTGSVY